MNDPIKTRKAKDRIEGNSIVLDGEGQFPKDIVIRYQKALKRYRLVKTKTGKFQLNK